MLDYRDPLFSVILFLSLIVFTILVTNFIGSLREKNRVKHLKNFIDKFDFLDDKECIELWKIVHVFHLEHNLDVLEKEY